MKLTPENIADLKVGDKVYLSSTVSIPECYTYVGILDNQRHYVKYGGGSFTLLVGHEDSDTDLKYGNMFTTREEVNLRLREHLLNQIDHYNRHQLKACPIVIYESGSIVS